MPRLILEDDDGRELFRGQVSQQNVEIVAGFLRRNMGALRAAAAFKKSLEGLGVGELLVAALGAPAVNVRNRTGLGAAPRRPRGGRR